MAADDLLNGLRALALARRAMGDETLILQPNPTAQEEFEPSHEYEGLAEQGLVLEPFENAPFEMRDLAARQQHVQVKAFCDGVRSTFFLGFEGLYPLLYARNASAVRIRDEVSGYHRTMYHFHRRYASLLAPFDLLPPHISRAYERLGLYTQRLANLCWTGLDGMDESHPTPKEMLRMGNLAWQSRARRRARHLLDLSEQITSIAGAHMLRELDSTGSSWLLKDGSLSQFKREHLQRPDPLRNIVSCVKTHPVPYFGIEGERKIRQLEIGQRSVAFLPRPAREAQQHSTLTQSDRPMISWYLRVQPSHPHHANHMSGIIRLDIAAVDDWTHWIDEVSWSILDEFYSISALPDPRADVMSYGIYDCEQFLKSHQIPGTLLLAQLH